MITAAVRWESHCTRCHHRLTRLESIKVGMGPTCRVKAEKEAAELPPPKPAQMAWIPEGELTEEVITNAEDD